MLRDILRKAREEKTTGELPEHLSQSYALEVHDSEGRQVGLIAVFGDEIVSLYVPEEKLDADKIEKIDSAVEFTGRGPAGLTMAKDFFTRKYKGVEFKKMY